MLLKRQGFSAAMAVPLIGPGDLPAKWAPLGQLDKYVPLAGKRIVQIREAGSTQLVMDVQGVPAETVEVCALYFDGTEKLTKLCDSIVFEQQDEIKTVTLSR